MSQLGRLIRINQHDRIWENFKEKYKVSPGDLLEVMDVIDCKKIKGKCWEVRNTITGEFGFVEAKRMERLHSIYDKK